MDRQGCRAAPLKTIGRMERNWLLGGVVAWLVAGTVPLVSHELRGQELDPFQVAAAFEKVLVQAIARSEKSVVAIARARRPVDRDRFFSPEFVPHEFATGVVIDRQGLILTNYHVLGQVDQNEYAVWQGRRPFVAQVKAADPWSDLAVLAIEATDLAPIEMGDAQSLAKGQIVIALGNPYAIARDGSPSATWGIISNLGRKAPPTQQGDVSPESKNTLHHFGALIQTDARLNLGTSGGALVNLKGEMIGLTTSMAALAGYEKSAGFAVPMDPGLRRVIDQLKKGREPQYGFLGVRVEPLALSERLGGRFGVRLGQIVLGTPADKHGLKQGDIVTHVDDQSVYAPDDLIRYVSTQPVGEMTRLRIIRTDPDVGQQTVQTINVVLSKKHVETLRPVIAAEPKQVWRGMRVDYATAVPSLAEQSLYIDKDGCVAIVDVEPDSPAWRVGLRPGVYVSYVNDQRVANPEEFYRSASLASGAVRLTLTAPIDDAFTVTLGP
jgi:serine protease Do